MDQPANNQLVDHLFRHESGKMISVLIRIFGMHNLEMAEDVVQEAFLKAMQSWAFHGVPDNPSAWLMRTARNGAIDIIRRQQNFDLYSRELGQQLQSDTESAIEQFFLDTEIADSQLRLIFACCHPSLREEDQVALTLKTVSGFSAGEIARALVTNEATIQKRLYRARQYINNNGIQLEIPLGQQLPARLDTVHTVLYLLFNEGYHSMKSDELIRRDLCAEAMRLCLLLSEHKAGSRPSTHALLSLMCFQASRFDSRVSEDNSIVLLSRQDRSKWNRPLIGKGYHYLNLSSCGDQLSVYHIESAIAAEHCIPGSFEETNWQRLLSLYDLLLQHKQTPTVWLNRAVVLAQLGKPLEAIREIWQIEDIDALLTSQHIYSMVLGELYGQAGDKVNAVKYLHHSFRLTGSQPEQKLLLEKINQLQQICGN
ncbi:MAG: sigma-70 family RNA polymerase sigma factor [Bacteroidetes bacterium]|nr:sigma-70 family RNA polymerase sigma factor [Bacteroidota bacterium]